MSEKRIGTLIYDPSMGRFDIRFGIESYYGGLHCGECFDVKVKDAWIPVRIEMDEDWYLVGLPKIWIFIWLMRTRTRWGCCAGNLKGCVGSWKKITVDFGR